MPSAPMRAPAAPNTEYSRQIMSQNHGRGRAGDEFDEAGLKLVFQMTLMTIGLYNEPTGAYMPSVLY